MYRKTILTTAIIAGVIMSSTAVARELTIGQMNKTFVIDGKQVEELSVSVGDKIHFQNQDPWFHNIFSLSDTKLFDLGSYPKGESRDVVFDKAGEVEVECAIHPQMYLLVNVK